MKTCLISILLLAAAITSGVAQTQTQTLTAPVTTAKPPQRAAPPVSQRTVVDGVIPRAIRGGNPLQLLNPRAPRKYGTSLEAVSYVQEDPLRWRGIKLFEFRF